MDIVNLNWQVRYSNSPQEVMNFNTEQLRECFLIEELMVSGNVNLVYSHYDRMIIGGVVPDVQSLTLHPIDPLKSDYFLERRELGVINVGGSGKVIVDGSEYLLDNQEAIYIGKSCKEVIFDSQDYQNPAVFYMNSTPAHKIYPVSKIGQQDAEIIEIGSFETANSRTIKKLIVNGLVDTCQVQMGLTEIKPGSVWNTMPAHVHDRRMEVYFYFGISKDQAVCHFMGQPNETRHLWLGDHQAVISPPWSIHAGCGTSSYSFIWGMAGENLDYSDMDHCRIQAMR